MSKDELHYTSSITGKEIILPLKRIIASGIGKPQKETTMKSMQEFIDEHRDDIDAAILNVPGMKGHDLDDNDRKDWIANDEGLYNWACDEGVDASMEELQSHLQMAMVAVSNAGVEARQIWNNGQRGPNECLVSVELSNIFEDISNLSDAIKDGEVHPETGNYS